MTTPYLPAAPLVSAILAMVRAAVPVSCGIYESASPPEAEPPFAVFYFDAGRKALVERTVLNNGPRDLRYQTISVGSTPEQARWVADKVAAALYGATPSVLGRQVWPVIEESSQPIRRDDQSSATFLATSQWLTRSE